MPNHYTRAALTLLMNDLKPVAGADQITHALIQKLEALQMGTHATWFLEAVSVIPEIEKTAISCMELVAEKKINLQLYFPPASVFIHVDRLFVQLLFYKLFTSLLHHANEASAMQMHVAITDVQCIIDCTNKTAAPASRGSDDYFKKYRITNPIHGARTQTEEILPVYTQLVTDLGGVLLYAFSKEKNNYFRLKFPLA